MSFFAALVTAPTLISEAAVAPVPPSVESMVASAVNVTAATSIRVSVVATVPAIVVAPAVVSKPPANVVESAASLPIVTPDVFRNVVSVSITLAAP